MATTASEDDNRQLTKASSLDEAIQEIGVGKTQWGLLVLCGLTFCSDAAEITFLSFVTEVLKCDWGITEEQETYLTSAVFLGMIVGAPVWGYISDNVGRRPSFLISSVVITSFGMITACTQTFYQLLTCRAVVGFGVAGLPVGFDILAEALTAESRGKFLLYIEYFWTLGSIWVNLCAWHTLEVSWRFFTLLTALPTIISSVAGFFLLPESPLWLLEQGQDAKALEVVNRWAKTNGSKSRFTMLKHSVESEASMSDLVTKKPIRKNLLLMVAVWLGFGIGYYGIVMELPRIFENTSKHPADPQVKTPKKVSCDVEFDFTDLGIATLAESVGVIVAIQMIDNPGRCFTQGFFYAVGAACALALGFRSIGKNVLTGVASLGRLSMMAASCATWVHTPEIFPTHVRSLAHGVLNLFSKIGAFIAPFLISDMFTQKQCGMIMGGITIAGGLCSFLLPETAGKTMSGKDADSEDSADEDDDDEDSSSD